MTGQEQPGGEKGSPFSDTKYGSSADGTRSTTRHTHSHRLFGSNIKAGDL